MAAFNLVPTAICLSCRKFRLVFFRRDIWPWGRGWAAVNPRYLFLPTSAKIQVLSLVEVTAEKCRGANSINTFYFSLFNSFRRDISKYCAISLLRMWSDNFRLVEIRLKILKLHLRFIRFWILPEKI